MTGLLTSPRAGGAATLAGSLRLEAAHHVLGADLRLLVLGTLARGVAADRGRACDYLDPQQGERLGRHRQRRLHRVDRRVSPAAGERRGPLDPARRARVFRHRPLAVCRSRGAAPPVDDAAPARTPLADRPLRRRDPRRRAHRLRPDERSWRRRPRHPIARLDRPAARHLHRPPLWRADRPGNGLLGRGGVDRLRLGGPDRAQPAGRFSRPGRRHGEPDAGAGPRPRGRRADRPGAGGLWHRHSRGRPRGTLHSHGDLPRVASRPRRPAPHAGAAAQRRRLARRTRLDARSGRSGRSLLRAGGAADHQCAALRRHRSRLGAAERLGRGDADGDRGLDLPVAATSRLCSGAACVLLGRDGLSRLCRELRADG